MNMSKKYLNVFLSLIFTLNAPAGFAQGQRWVSPPYNINMNGAAPVVTTIPGATPGTNNISNGAYGPNGQLEFYVKDLSVYLGSSSQLLGKLPNSVGSAEGSEVEIVRVPGPGLRFYVIYTTYLTSQGRSLFYVKVDCTHAALVFSPALNTNLPSSSSPYFLECNYFDAQGLALSKPIFSLVTHSTSRYLFTVGFKGSPKLGATPYNYGGLLRWTIDANGIHNQTVIATTTDLNHNYGNYYDFWNYLTVSQMSLSDDQTRLAWGGGTGPGGGAGQAMLFEVKLNPTNYSYVPGSFRQYFIPYTHAHRIAGVEYATGSNKLYVSTRDGLFYVPTYGSTPVFIPGSVNLTQQSLSSSSGSQLQYVKSMGKIVGVKVTNTAGHNGTLFSIDPANNNIASLLTTPLTSWNGEGLTLPDLPK